MAVFLSESHRIDGAPAFPARLAAAELEEHTAVR